MAPNITDLPSSLCDTAEPSFVSIATWFAISGMNRSSTYDALNRGDMRGIKLGHRLLIEVEPSLAWLRSLSAYTPQKTSVPQRAA